MKKALFITVIVLFLNNANAQLQIGANTSWHSDPTTYVVLDNTGIQYDAATAQLANIFKFTGNADVNIAGSNQPVFTKIELAKTGAAKVSLQRSINLTQSLNFQGGLFDLNGFNIDMETNALLLNENETSRIIGTDGEVIIPFVLNGPSSVNPGNLGAIITSTQNLGNTSIHRGVKPQTNSNGLGNSVLRYYKITPANNTALNASLRFNYFDTELNGLNENSLELFKSADGNVWSDVGFTSRDASLNYVGLFPVNDFSVWTLSEKLNALPLYFLNFSAACTGNEVWLQWKITTNEPGDMLIQNSMDGSNWNTLTALPANITSGDQQFSYHISQSQGIFYRIAFKQQSGSMVYTKISKTTCGASLSCKVYPNPFSKRIEISIINNKESDLNINVYDAKGVLLQKNKAAVHIGNSVLKLDLPGLSKGTYFLQLLWNDGMQNKWMKIIKQ